LGIGRVEVTSASSNGDTKGYIFTQTSNFEKENYNSCNSEDNIGVARSECLPILGEFQKNSILNNNKFLFDNNTERNRKRSQQMKKIRSNHESKDYRDDEFVKFLREDDQRDTTVKEDITVASNAVIQGNYVEPIVDSEQQQGEVMISDIDCSIDDDQQSLSSKSSKSSFVPITNNLTLKSSLKDNNLTASYLLALNGAAEHEEESPSDDINEENGPYDSLNDKLRKSNREFKHVRLPSGKNYLISSVIEEEVSGVYSDSEISTKRKSVFRSKNKLNSSEKLRSLRSSIGDNILVEKSQKVESNRSKLSDSIKELSRREIAKSEVFNIQFDIKRTFDEMSKKHLQKEEQNKLKMETKKKILVENFIKKSHSSSNGFEGIDLNNALKKIEINEKSSDEIVNLEDKPVDKPKHPVININLTNSIGGAFNKKSPSSLGREKFYGGGSDQKSIRESSIENSDHKESHLSHRNPIVEDNQKSMKSLRDLYKHCRKKSSFFPSEDLKVSKIDNINYYNISETKTQDHCSYININNNINICSPISINSIPGELIENRGDTDRTLMNPIEMLKGAHLDFLTPDKPNDYTHSSNVKKHSMINLNLTISRNDMSFNENSNNSSYMYKKKLFEGASARGDGVCKDINNVAIMAAKPCNFAISNAINIDIIRE
jgi:hypothetical protein